MPRRPVEVFKFVAFGSLAVAAIVVGVANYIWSRNDIHTDGIYINSCCEPVRLIGDNAYIGPRSVRMQLIRMKFGLTAVPATELCLFGDGGKCGKLDPDSPVLLFDKLDHPGSFIAVNKQNKQYVFVKQQKALVKKVIK